MLLPVILAGGSGTRMWPLSRMSYPKQFLSLYSDDSMIQDTFNRLKNISHDASLVICNDEHRFLVAEQLRRINNKKVDILLEPVGKNTAPAVALAAIKEVLSGRDPILLVLAADHIIKDVISFENAVRDATILAETGKLVTFGITANKPETGYGYIKKGEKVSESGYAVDSFHEKPSVELACDFLSEGNYLWNSGMFLFKASAYLSELEKYRPDILLSCQKAFAGSYKDLDFIRIDANSFSCCPSESIDFAVMENTKESIVVPMDAEWNDVGSWLSLWDISKKNEDGNVIRGDVIQINSANNFLYSDCGLLATVGINNLIVVKTKDATLIANSKDGQDVKKVVDRLKELKRTEHINNHVIFKPWGEYDMIENGTDYQVGRITLRPGKKIQNQIHYHRAEHWIVISGTALVHCGENTFVLESNKSTFIPAGVTHSLENPGKVPLEVIEIKTGNYLEDDDMVRMP